MLPKDFRPEDIPDEAELDRLEAEKSLYRFLKQSWHVIEPATLFVPCRNIELMAEHLEAVTAGSIQNLLLLVPPGSLKSTTVCVAWQAWEWIKNPWTRWLFSSYSLRLAERDSERFGDLVRSRWYQQRWGDRFKITTDAKIELKNDKKGWREVTSVAGSTTGTHADRLCCDDPHNLKEVESETIREGTIRWHDQAWYNRVNDEKKSTRVVIGQRTHPKDLLGHLREQGDYVVLCLPEEYDAKISRCWPGAKLQDNRKDGELLRPDRFDETAVIGAKKRLGSAGYAAQHQQNPRPREGGLVKEAWIRRYVELGDAYRLDNGEVFHHELCWSFVAIDPAFSKKQTADHIAMGVFTVLPQGWLLVRHMLRDRLAPQEWLPVLNRLCQQFRPAWCAIEAVQNQDLFVSSARDVAPVPGQMGWVRRWPYIPEIRQLTLEGMKKGTASKAARAQPMIIKMENGEIFLPARNVDDPDDWVGIFEDELTSVTGVGDEEDDQFDAMAWAVLTLQRMGLIGQASEAEGAFVCGPVPQVGPLAYRPQYDMCHYGQW